MMSDMVTPSPIATSPDEVAVPRSIGRALDLLEIVLAEHRCTLTRAATLADLTPTTALRYLRALEGRGYLERDTAGEYSAGPTLARIAASVRSDSALGRLAGTAQPLLDDLTRRTGESSYLAVSDGRTGTCIATAESPRAIRHVGWVGQSVPLDGSALGAALLDPGTVVVRTGAVEPDITAMSRAVTTTGSLHVAISIVGPEHRFGDAERTRHELALNDAVDGLERTLRINGEDFTS
jgi:DNA-binding IclR family transcriptional regulator